MSGIATFIAASTQYAILPSAVGNLTGDFVLEIPIKFTASAADKCIISKRDTSYAAGVAKGWQISQINSTKKLALQASGANGTASSSIQTLAALTDSVQYWVRIIRSGTTISLYLSTDGITYVLQESSILSNLNAGLNASFTAEVQLGRRWSSNAFAQSHNGNIYYIKIWEGTTITGTPSYYYNFENAGSNNVILNSGDVGVSGNGRLYNGAYQSKTSSRSWKQAFGLPMIPGFVFAKETSYANYKTNIIDTSTCDIHDLGVSSLVGANIYGLSIGTLDGSKPILYVQGQIHGSHEYPSAHWIPRLMDLINSPPLWLPQKAFFEALKAEFDIYAIPCVNPYGYDQNSYLNFNSVNVNRNFDYGWTAYEPGVDPNQAKGAAAFDQPEAVIVRDIIQLYKPQIYIDVHSWGGYAGHILKSRDSTFLSSAMYNIENLVKRVCSTEANAETPTSTNWVSTQLSASGEGIIALTYETGSLETLYEQTRIGMNGVSRMFWDALLMARR